MNAESVHSRSPLKPRVFHRASRLAAAWVLLSVAAASPAFATKILSPLSKMCLQLTAEAATPEMKPCEDIAHQEWEFNPAADKGYILSLQRFKCLKTTGSTADPITLVACNDSDSSQKWNFNATTRRFSYRSDATKCLGIENGSEGAKMILADCASGDTDSQKWYLEDITNGERWYDNGSVYLVDRGLLRHVPGEAFASGGVLANWFRVRCLKAGCPNTNFIGDFLTGPDLPTTAELIQQSGTAAVYLVDGGTKRWIISTAVMSKYNFDWSKVHSKTSAEMSAYSSGPDIK